MSSESAGREGRWIRWLPVAIAALCVTAAMAVALAGIPTAPSSAEEAPQDAAVEVVEGDGQGSETTEEPGSGAEVEGDPSQNPEPQEPSGGGDQQGLPADGVEGENGDGGATCGEWHELPVESVSQSGEGGQQGEAEPVTPSVERDAQQPSDGSTEVEPEPEQQETTAQQASMTLGLNEAFGLYADVSGAPEGAYLRVDMPEVTGIDEEEFLSSTGAASLETWSETDDANGLHAVAVARLNGGDSDVMLFGLYAPSAATVRLMASDGSVLAEGDVSALRALVPAVEAAGDQVWMDQGEMVYYAGWGTREYWIDGHRAVCANPQKESPSSGTYTEIDTSSVMTESVRYAELIADMWYGPDGPGFEWAKENLWPKTWYDGTAMTDDRYFALLHILVADTFTSNGEAAFYGTDPDFASWVRRWITGFDYGGIVYPDAVGRRIYTELMGNVDYDNYHVYCIYTTGWTQYIIWGEYTPPQTGSLTIWKGSSIPAITDGNSCYSLTGAEYTVYNGPECRADQFVATLTTGVTGGTVEANQAWLDGFAAGTYYVKETKASPGYALDQTLCTIQIDPGEAEVLELYEVPQNDPLAMIAMKVDADTGQPSPQGAGTLAGAEFTVKYYAGYYDSISDLPSSATRTWVISTNESGYALFSTGYLVSGDSFYLDSNGSPTIPLGTVTVQETRAPEGYILTDSTPRLQQVTSSGTLEPVETYVVPTFEEEPIRGGLSLQKVDADTGTGLKGAEFEVVNDTGGSVFVGGQTYADGEVVLTLTTGADGRASTASDALPYGTYLVRESKAPSGYQPDSTPQSVTVSKDGVVVACGSAFEDTKGLGGLSLVKRDDLTGDGSAQGNATLLNAVFEVVNANDYDVVVGGKPYSSGQVVMTIATDEGGSASTGPDVLPAGTYEVREVTAPTGYRATAPSQTVKVVAGEVAQCSVAFEDRVISGGVAVAKVDSETGQATPQGQATFQGAVFEVTNESDAAVMVAGRPYEPGEVVLTLVTDASGRASSSASALPYGDYSVRETAAPAGYLVNGDVWEFSVTSEGQMHYIGA